MFYGEYKVIFTTVKGFINLINGKSVEKGDDIKISLNRGSINYAILVNEPDLKALEKQELIVFNKALNSDWFLKNQKYKTTKINVLSKIKAAN